MKVVRREWLSTTELAERTGYTVGTLATMRWQGKGPAFDHIGRTVIYWLDEVKRWEASRKSPARDPLLAPKPEKRIIFDA